MITYKLKYSTDLENKEFIRDLQRQYSICFKVIYKYSKLGWTQKQITNKLFNYKNIDFIINNSWFRASLFYDAKSLLQQDKICFRAKYLHKRDKGIITKEEWKKLKLLPICSIGDVLKKGNRFFRFKNENTLIFCPNRNTKIQLNLQNVGKNRLKTIKRLIGVQESCSYPITYRLDQEYVYVSFDEKIIKNNFYVSIENRIFAVDLNPNYIGYSVINWIDTEKLNFRIIKTGIIDFKHINDKHFYFNKQRTIPSTDNHRIHLNNKRTNEVLQASKFLVNQAKHYKCEIFAVEDLNIPSKDKQKGKNYNALCNNVWYRNKIVGNITKRCNQENITLQKIQPQYSSILGNLIYRKLNLPDMILSSIEISRRCQEFNLQYNKQEKEKKKNIIYPELNSKIKSLLHQSMEELGVNDKSYNLDELFSIFKFLKKNHEIKYHVPLQRSACKASQLRLKKYPLVSFNNL